MSAWIEVEHDLEAEQRDREDDDGQGGDDAQRDLAAVDVAEESHRQRDRLDELEHELDRPTNSAMMPAPMPFLNS